jgi:molybdopterin synthase sulfur carrier subunit
MAEAPVRVVFTDGFSRHYTGGETEFAIAATSLRGVIKELDRRFPGLGVHLEEETTVAIDGVLYEVGYLQPLAAGAEVFFIPKIEGG